MHVTAGCDVRHKTAHRKEGTAQPSFCPHEVTIGSNSCSEVGIIYVQSNIGACMSVEQQPIGSRPKMDGYGVHSSAKGMLPWEWALERLSGSPDYWLTTVRRTGKPQHTP